MGIYSIKPKFQHFLQPLTQFLIQARVHPDILNWLGFSFSVAAAVCLLLSRIHPSLLLMVPVLTGFRLTVNALDGQVSRGLHLDSAWGEVKNEIFDRTSDALIFISLGLSLPLLLLPAAIVASTTLIHSFIGVLAKAIGQPRNYVGIMGKPDRMFALSLACLIVFFTDNHGLFAPLLWLILFFLVISIIQKLKAIYAHL